MFAFCSHFEYSPEEYSQKVSQMRGGEIHTGMVDTGVLQPQFSLMNVMVLAAIDRRPAHGYAIYWQIQQVVWARVMVQPALVYKTLQRLERAGYVEFYRQVGRAKEFLITPEGSKLLRQDVRLLERVIHGTLSPKL